MRQRLIPHLSAGERTTMKMPADAPAARRRTRVVHGFARLLCAAVIATLRLMGIRQRRRAEEIVPVRRLAVKLQRRRDIGRRRREERWSQDSNGRDDQRQADRRTVNFASAP